MLSSLIATVNLLTAKNKSKERDADTVNKEKGAEDESNSNEEDEWVEVKGARWCQTQGDEKGVKEQTLQQEGPRREGHRQHSRQGHLEQEWQVGG